MATYLQTLRPIIGQFEANKAEIKAFFIERLQELSDETKNDKLNLDLCKNMARMTRLVPILLLFQNTPEEVAKYDDFSWLISQTNEDHCHGNL